MPMSIISQCLLSAARKKVSYFIKVEYNIIMSLGIFGISCPRSKGFSSPFQLSGTLEFHQLGSNFVKNWVFLDNFYYNFNKWYF